MEILSLSTKIREIKGAALNFYIEHINKVAPFESPFTDLAQKQESSCFSTTRCSVKSWDIREIYVALTREFPGKFKEKEILYMFSKKLLELCNVYHTSSHANI